jgi:hypothetical protein
MKRDVFERMMNGLNELRIQGMFDKTLTPTLFKITNKNYLVIKMSDELSETVYALLPTYGWIHDHVQEAWYFDLGD